jgi:two-component system chemotaxis response regulator CheY
MTEILIVEDTHVGRRMLRAALERCGLPDLRVVEADDGEGAAELLAERTFDLVLCDLYLPSLNGRELLGAARARGLQVPFVFVTAERSPETAAALLAAGALAVLSKPCNAAALGETLAGLTVDRT